MNIFFVISFFIIEYEVFCYPGELLAAVVVFRDGERAPVKYFPEDPWKAKWESIGYGQLTMQGKDRMFQLGKWLRHRYDRHIPARYTKQAIFVRSIDYDEAITSAYMVLAGLYPPLEDQILNKHLQWQPIPVHTEKISNDYILMGSQCRQVDNLERVSFRAFEESDNYTDWLASKFNIKPNENVTMVDVIESILSAVSMNLQPDDQSDWMSSEMLSEIEDKLASELEGATSTPDLARLKLGPFFYELIDYFNRFQPGTVEVDYKPKFKVMFYAGVMETLVNIISGLRIVGILNIPEHIPKFGAALLIELRDGGSGKRYINISYRNSSSTLKEYKINGCGLDCNYDTFVEKVKPINLEYEQAISACES